MHAIVRLCSKTLDFVMGDRENTFFRDSGPVIKMGDGGHLGDSVG